MTDTMEEQQETAGQLRNRVALVTGGARGIGAAIGQRLAQEGAAVAAGYWRHEEPAQKFLEVMTADHPGRRITLHEGNIGAADRLDFTAIGPAVNLVSRLEGLCKPLDKAVLVSGTLAAETSVSLILLGTHELRGIASPCAVFTVPES